MTAPWRTRRWRRVGCAAVAAAVVAGTTACGPAKDTDEDTLVVWSLENLPERVAATRAIVDRFSEETGIDVQLVAVDEQQVPQLIQSAVLSDEMPDVIGALSLSYVRQIADLGLVDTAATNQVVADLGPETFEESALELTSDDEDHLAVPSDAWSQVLVYRKDLFEKAGLQPPTTYDAIRTAADELTGDGRFGITLATDPADVFTTQSFESLALSNDCQLVDTSGDAALDSPACQQAWDLYGQLATENSPRGTQSVDSTRATYFNGTAAMTVWSTFILDELAGLRNDAMPACDECEDDPEWLARNSGVVTSISGPDNPEGATYGEITSWTLLDGAPTDRASRLVEYMLSEGYEDWIGMAPEGKFPVRTGDAENPTRFTDAWEDLEAGVDTKKPLSDVYDAQTMDALRSVAENIDRWAITQGQGAVLGPVSTQLPLSKTVSELANGLPPEEAAAQAQSDVESITEEVDE
ncbi:ABC transporter substrate-binding protein [Nocardioides albus]|uniref:Multiple sugar transport system substrate-binding protein n=1 Tax=Nocardioides albus TaxID=1841 RepID=A0A7W5A1H0_9ACTN|nr:extracellular solute-binding protein [Nocardioides albus]MBB3087928.1 multiple sugar transport system substrate-binding protein [Nocardioides albus]